MQSPKTVVLQSREAENETEQAGRKKKKQPKKAIKP